MENNVNINKGKKGPNLESKKTMEEQISKTVILEYQSKVHIYSLNNKQQFKESLQTAGM